MTHRMLFSQVFVQMTKEALDLGSAAKLIGHDALHYVKGQGKSLRHIAENPVSSTVSGIRNMFPEAVPKTWGEVPGAALATGMGGLGVVMNAGRVWDAAKDPSFANLGSAVGGIGGNALFARLPQGMKPVGLATGMVGSMAVDSAAHKAGDMLDSALHTGAHRTGKVGG